MKDNAAIINTKYYNNTNTHTSYNNTIQYNKVIALRIHGKLLQDYLSLKDRRKILKDSVLLRPILQAGIVTCGWLEDKGLLSLNTLKVDKILAGLSQDEREELFEALRKEFAV